MRGRPEELVDLVVVKAMVEAVGVTVVTAEESGEDEGLVVVVEVLMVEVETAMVGVAAVAAVEAAVAAGMVAGTAVEVADAAEV